LTADDIKVALEYAAHQMDHPILSVAWNAFFSRRTVTHGLARMLEQHGHESKHDANIR